MFEDKRILITGGTGSFGSTVLRKFHQIGAGSIRILSRDEKKQFDLRNEFNSSFIDFMIGDVRDPDVVDRATQDVDFVFHAAALKQVPSCEFFPMEAVKTNVIGANNVLNACIKNKVKAAVVLSTDKAVYPINAMGMSKALMEKTAQSYARFDTFSNTKICVTRYGNVVGSRGSVIPHFIELAKKGMKLSVTNPEMTRFLMSLDESVDLVIKGLLDGESGDLYVKKAPACNIGQLAEVINEIIGNKSGISIIGPRHGEKLYESLLTREELSSAEDLDAYFKVAIDARDQNYDSFFSAGTNLPLAETDYNSHNTTQMKNSELIDFLMKNNEISKLL